MSKYIQVKIFWAMQSSDLQDDINSWLNKRDDIVMIDIKFNRTDNSYSAMIIYEVVK